MTIRLVATDIDGTLLRSDHTVSPRAVDAIKAATAAGIFVVFVSGRPPRWLDDVADQTGHVGTAVGANGAVIYDMHDEQIRSAHWIDRPILAELTTDLRTAFPDVAFAAEQSDRFAAEQEYVHDWAINPNLNRPGHQVAPPVIGSLDDVLAHPAFKLLAKDRGADVDRFLLDARAVIGARGVATHSSSYGLLEISAPGVTKATGLAEVAESLGVSASEVAAIGDMPNDIPMLQWAGHSYAVANAHPDTQNAAGTVTVSNDDDAVALLIESVIAGQ